MCCTECAEWVIKNYRIWEGWWRRRTTHTGNYIGGKSWRTSIHPMELPVQKYIYLIWSFYVCRQMNDEKGCGAAQIVAHRLAVRQARVRISARHSRGGPLSSGCNEDNMSGSLRVVYCRGHARCATSAQVAVPNSQQTSWLFSRVLASQAGGPGSNPRRNMSVSGPLD